MTDLTGRKLFNFELKLCVKGSCFASFKAFIIDIIITRKSQYQFIDIQLNQMIQMSREKSVEKETTLQGNTYIIFRIIYASILIAFLLLISFYFDLLSDYDALSLVLGFVICIILQFFFLSYYFRHEMKKYKIDEIGVLKWKIKLIFGELNQKHIEKKNKIKYYRHQGNQKDRLFHKDNEQIYQNVMSYLRGKEEPNFTEMITKTKTKWNFLEEKIILLQKFLSEMLKHYESRRHIYNRYKAGIVKIKEKKQYKQWQQFLKEEDKHDKKRAQMLNNTSFYSQHSSNPGLNSSRISHSTSQKVKLNWEIFNWFILQKAKLNEKEVNCLKENIIKEYSIYVRNIKQSKDFNSRARERLLSDFKAAREDKNQIVKEIEKISIKYSEIKQSLENNRIKQEEDVEVILKKEFDLRLQKIELENYEIKISRAQSLILYSSELLHNHLELEEMELEDHLNKLNSKFTNYLNMMAGIGQSRTPIIKKYFEQEKNMDNSFREEEIEIIKDFDVLLQKSINRRKSELTFKNYLIQVLNLFKEMSNNHNESHSLIQDYKPKFQLSLIENSKSQGRMKKEMTGARLHYYASNVKDLKILKMFETLNSFQCKLTQIVADQLLRQSTILSIFEEQYGLNFSKEMKKCQEQIKRKEEQIKKIKRKSNKQQGDIANETVSIELTQLKDKLSGLTNQYLQIYKVPTTLVDLIEAMIENQTLYEKYANELAEEEQFERSNETVDNEDTRARQRLTAYVNCNEKLETTEFDEDSLDQNNPFQFEKERQYLEGKSKNQVQIWSFANYSLRESLTKQNNKQALKILQLNTFKESILRSNDMINRLLGVLFNQWSKSEFFHQFVKEELISSLNRKKPDIVEHLNIQYFKIVDRVKSIGPIKSVRIHQSEIYRCLFDIVLDFKGLIAVQIGTRLKISKKPALQIKLLIKQFQCPIRLCFTPYSLGKSYASLLERPKLSIDYIVTLGGFNLTKIPFFKQIIKTYIVLKLRKKMLWPKRMTLPVPLAFKSTIELAIAQRNKFERDKQKFEKKVQ